MPKVKDHSRLLQNLPSFRGQQLYDNSTSDPASQNNAGPLLNVEKRSEPVKSSRSLPYRRAVGGRGREWATECLKLLEALLELEDSKPVREPVNPLKFPDYYSKTNNPTDLSKVMLKFHSGNYSTLDLFAKDMNLMFSNYKNFFKEADSEIYTQVHRLSWWFDTELARIHEKWGKPNPAGKVKQYCRRSPKSALRTPEAAMSDQAAAMEVEPHSRFHQSSKLTPETSGPGPGIGYRSPMIENISGIPDLDRRPNHATVSSLLSLSSRPRILKRTSSESTNPRYPIDSPNITTGIPIRVAPQPSLLKRQPVPPASHEPLIARNEATPSFQTPAHSTGTKRAAPRSRLSSTSLTVSLEMNVSNVWFGMARVKPKKPAIFSESGLQMYLSQNSIDVPFTIHADEIVRCVAHFGRSSPKHTLFLFVLPSCSKRLNPINEKCQNCSMIVVFFSLASNSSISTLLHICWNISKTSLFGPIFSEVDQKGALVLLGNIKPGIMQRVVSKYKNVLTEEAMNLPDFNQIANVGCESTVAEESGRGSSLVSHSDEGAIASTSSESVPTVVNDMSGTNETEAESSIMPDSSMEQGESSENPASKTLDTDFAERIGASLQQGFKEGFTEMIKSLTDTLYKKRYEETKEADTTPGPTDQGESDVEIVIPTDSEEETSRHSNLQEDELAVTKATVSIRCPITQQVMKHPMKNKHCGHCYDRQGVEELIRNRKDKAKCPVPGCSNTTVLAMTDMKCDYDLWHYIQERVNPDFSKEFIMPSKKEGNT